MIVNKSKKKVLAKNKMYCRNWISKSWGLMFSKKLVDKGYIFSMAREKKVDLHMFFVFHAIDVLWLDKNKRVVQIKENFKPFRMVLSKKPSMYIIELPVGAVEESGTSIGDVIEF